MNIIVYDFDKTIYRKETTIEFTKFLVRKKPLLIFKVVFFSLFSLINIRNLKKSKEIFWHILKGYNRDDIKVLVDEFWSTQKEHFFSYFNDEIKKNKKECEQLILISASPTFILESIYKELGFDKLIATDYIFNNNIFTSKIDGYNCKNDYKVLKLNEYMKDYNILKFYSDSISDKPLYDLSQEKYFIDKGILKKGLPTNKKYIDNFK